MAKIYLYGKLRRFGAGMNAAGNNVINVIPEPGETVASLLARIEIPVEELYSIFLNHKLLATKSQMARWIGYRQATQDPFDWGLSSPVEPNDRIGLFGRDMALLVV